jgi:hypothetical protein
VTRAAILGVGYGFLLFGVLGLFLPVLQGVLFIVVGLLILAPHAEWAGRLLTSIKRRHPRAERLVGAAEAIALRWQVRTRTGLRRAQIWLRRRRRSWRG